MLTKTEENNLLIRAGRVMDPFTGRNEIADVAVVDGFIAEAPKRDAHVIDATGWIVCPGLMDIHVHLREPGQTHKETIETGTAAAAAGGFTFVACMPNTKPPLDQPDALQLVLKRARHANNCEVGPVAAITRGRLGVELTDFEALLKAGAVSFSDDGDGVEDDGVMREAFEQAGRRGALLIQHCEYAHVSAGGVMHLGETSRSLRLPGLDPRSEEAMLERDLMLCRETGARYHVAHISTARAVEAVRRAKAEGLPVTAEVSPHHLALTDEACAKADPHTKMHPPLRTAADVDACRRGLVDGTIDCIATDHAPHTLQEKAAGFAAAPPGIVGLETAVGVAARAMIQTNLADWLQLVHWFTRGPCRVLRRLETPILAGHRALLTLLDPEVGWTVDPTTFLSRGRNTPFSGWTLQGRAVGTIRGKHVARPLHAISRDQSA
jgi:dihydroorotase